VAGIALIALAYLFLLAPLFGAVLLWAVLAYLAAARSFPATNSG